jgi:thiol-disulfide isomerase/thioredoxin
MGETNTSRSNISNSIIVLGCGIIALVLSSYTRTFKAEYIQFSSLILFFLLAGFILNRFYKKSLPFPILFLFPTISVLCIGFFLNPKALFHFIGESLTIIPCFFVGFYFSSWSKKNRVLTSIALVLFYCIYIFKINPELHYYNDSVRFKGAAISTSKPIPNFTFITRDGKSLILNEYRGKVILIDFYFNNCAPCIKKMPALLKIKNHYKENKDFILLLVHRGGSEAFSDFIEKLNDFPFDLNYAYDSSSVASKYLGITGYPLEILIGKNGVIREQFAGYSKDISLIYEKKTIKNIDALLNEKDN